MRLRVDKDPLIGRRDNKLPEDNRLPSSKNFSSLYYYAGETLAICLRNWIAFSYREKFIESWIVIASLDVGGVCRRSLFMKSQVIHAHETNQICIQQVMLKLLICFAYSLKHTIFCAFPSLLLNSAVHPLERKKKSCNLPPWFITLQITVRHDRATFFNPLTALTFLAILQQFSLSASSCNKSESITLTSFSRFLLPLQQSCRMSLRR